MFQTVCKRLKNAPKRPKGQKRSTVFPQAPPQLPIYAAAAALPDEATTPPDTATAPLDKAAAAVNPRLSSASNTVTDMALG